MPLSPINNTQAAMLQRGADLNDSLYRGKIETPAIFKKQQQQEGVTMQKAQSVTKVESPDANDDVIAQRNDELLREGGAHAAGIVDSIGSTLATVRDAAANALESAGEALFEEGADEIGVVGEQGRANMGRTRAAAAQRRINNDDDDIIGSPEHPTLLEAAGGNNLQNFGTAAAVRLNERQRELRQGWQQEQLALADQPLRRLALEARRLLDKAASTFQRIYDGFDEQQQQRVGFFFVLGLPIILAYLLVFQTYTPTWEKMGFMVRGLNRMGGYGAVPSGAFDDGYSACWTSKSDAFKAWSVPTTFRIAGGKTVTCDPENNARGMCWVE